LEEMARAIDKNEMVKTVSYEDATVNDLINVKWLLGLICGLIFCEWFLRKRGGEL
jgi:cell division protein FtsX